MLLFICSVYELMGGMSYDKCTVRLLGNRLWVGIKMAKTVGFKGAGMCVLYLVYTFARGPFALNNYTIGPMTTNRKVMYDFSIIKYWEAFADEK